ncbi:MAG: hypothetical protein ABIU11_00360 [Chitinophagaceae bacterium]
MLKAAVFVGIYLSVYLIILSIEMQPWLFLSPWFSREHSMFLQPVRKKTINDDGYQK